MEQQGVSKSEMVERVARDNVRFVKPKLGSSRRCGARGPVLPGADLVLNRSRGPGGGSLLHLLLPGSRRRAGAVRVGRR
jgi:hypothetical protein